MAANHLETSAYISKLKMDVSITTKTSAKAELWRASESFSGAWSEFREHLDGYHERLRNFGAALQNPDHKWTERDEVLLKTEGEVLTKKEQTSRERAVEVLQ